ncbi:MAG TPA: hypothetical protein VMZ52_20320 [Bryobacteraceae bacterium]|nr:hypothetical protein [Bryobacteraceae bacterium]
MSKRRFAVKLQPANTPYFSLPSTKLGANDFAIINNSGGSRQIQLPAKVQW